MEVLIPILSFESISTSDYQGGALLGEDAPGLSPLIMALQQMEAWTHEHDR